MFSSGLVILYSADLPRGLRFWRDLAGGEVGYRFPAEGEPEHVELRLAGMTIALTSAAGLVSHGLPPATAGAPFELVLRTEDTDATIATLRTAGVTVMIEPFTSPAGNRVAYVTDPDGNRVQIYSKP